MRPSTSLSVPLGRGLQLSAVPRRALTTSTLAQARLPSTLSSNRLSRAHAVPRPPSASPLARTLSISPRSYSTTSEPISYRDDSHPSPIYYHPLRPSIYALSLLTSIPKSEDSPSIIAFLDLRSLEKGKGDSSSTSEPAPGSPDFNPAALARRRTDLVSVHPPFLDLLHATLAECVNAGDAQLETEAKLRGSGWAHLGDEREETAAARIPNPENIIASVAFVDGEVQPSSYAPNDTYRIITREEGVMRLRSDWLEAVRSRCQEAEDKA